MHIKDLTEDQVCRLRCEIMLNSLFLGDYKNSFDIDTKEVCDFFNGFIEWAYGVWKEHHTSKANVCLNDIDTYANLLDYFREYRDSIE